PSTPGPPPPAKWYVSAMAPPTHVPVPRSALGVGEGSRLAGRRERSCSGPGEEAAIGQIRLRFPDRMLAEVEDRGREHRARPTRGDPFEEVFERPDAAARDHRYVDGGSHRLEQLDVVAGLRAVAIHRRQEDLARAEGADAL